MRGIRQCASLTEPAQQGKRVGKRRDVYGNVIEPAKVALGKRPTPRDARHTCASWLLGVGVPINWVQAHLGHESITTTVGRYGHVMPAARAAIAGAVSQALTGAHPQMNDNGCRQKLPDDNNSLVCLNHRREAVSN